jgi:hypothetical protein
MPFNNGSQRYNRLESNSFAGSSQGGNANLQVEQDKETIIRFIDELKYSDLRDNSLLELSR